jgi:hypothetical protein
MKYFSKFLIVLLLTSSLYGEEVSLPTKTIRSKMFSAPFIEMLNQQVDKFISDKEIVEIKFSSNNESTLGINHTNYSVIIIYKE